jgi:hypothetical protein
MPSPRLALSVLVLASLCLKPVQALVPTSCVNANVGRAINALDSGACSQTPTRMMVHEHVVSADLRQQILAPLSLTTPWAQNAQDIQMKLPVPQSLYKTITSLLNSDLASDSNVRSGVDKTSTVYTHESTVLVPARVSSKSVPLHHDRHRDKGGKKVEGFSAVLYLQGSGKMTFVDAATRVTVGEVDIVPGRMLVWENGPLLHQLDAADTEVPRVMLGPMSVNSIGELVGVGGPPVGGPPYVFRCNPSDDDTESEIEYTLNEDGSLANPEVCCMWAYNYNADNQASLVRTGNCSLATNPIIYLNAKLISSISNPSTVFAGVGNVK